MTLKVPEKESVQCDDLLMQTTSKENPCFIFNLESDSGAEEVWHSSRDGRLTLSGIGHN